MATERLINLPTQPPNVDLDTTSPALGSMKCITSSSRAISLISSSLGVNAGTGGAVASGDDTDIPIPGDAPAQASAAALDYTGAGTVTETEVGDEESYYEVEVTMDDGRQIDVQLDEAFNVVGDEDSEDDQD